MNCKKLFFYTLFTSLALLAQTGWALDAKKNETETYKAAFLNLCLNPTASQRYTLEIWAGRLQEIYDEKFCKKTAIDYFDKNAERIISLPSHKAIQDLSPFQYFFNLTLLEVPDNEIIDISMLHRLINLKKINIDRNKVINISVLSNFPNLEELSISSNPISDISFFAKLPKLKRLDFYETSFASLNSLRGLKMLEHLAFSQAVRKGNKDANPLISPPLRDEISQMSNLNSLSIMRVQIPDLCTIASLNRLEVLSLTRANISNIKCLKNLKDIDELSLSENPIQDLVPLEHLSKLRILKINSIPAKSIQPLAKLKELNILEINYSGVEDVSPISGRPNFSNLSTEGTHLRWCSPKDAIDVQKGRSCLNPDGSEKPWWKRLFHF
jgi:Leucine-rich repeat (LRR) protein